MAKRHWSERGSLWFQPSLFGAADEGKFGVVRVRQPPKRKISTPQGEYKTGTYDQPRQPPLMLIHSADKYSRGGHHTTRRRFFQVG